MKKENILEQLEKEFDEIRKVVTAKLDSNDQDSEAEARRIASAVSKAKWATRPEYSKE